METQGVALAWRSPYQRIPTDQLGYRRSSDAEHNHAADPGLAGVAQSRDTTPDNRYGRRSCPTVRLGL